MVCVCCRAVVRGHSSKASPWGSACPLQGFQSPGGIFVRPWDCCDFGMSFQVSFIGGGKGGSIASHCSSGSVSTLVSQLLP